MDWWKIKENSNLDNHGLQGSAKEKYKYPFGKETIMIVFDFLIISILNWTHREGDHSADFLAWPFFAVCIITNAVIWFMLLFRHDYVKTIIRERDYFRIVLMAINTYAVYYFFDFILLGVILGIS